MASLDFWMPLPDQGNIPLTEFNPERPDAEWTPKDDPPAPTFFEVDNHVVAKSGLNEHYAPLGFAVTIHYCNRSKLIFLKPEIYITSCILRYSAGRDYEDKSIGKRKRTSTYMT